MLCTKRLQFFYPSHFQDWQGKQPGFKGKWYEALVEDITVDLIEGRLQLRVVTCFSEKFIIGLFASAACGIVNLPGIVVSAFKSTVELFCAFFLWLTFF